MAVLYSGDDIETFDDDYEEGNDTRLQQVLRKNIDTALCAFLYVVCLAVYALHSWRCHHLW